MRGKKLVTIKGLSEILDRLGVETEDRGIDVIYVDGYDLSLFAMCMVNGYLLQTPFCWKDIHPDLVTIPCRWEYFLPYGFHYKRNPSKALERFLDFAKEWGDSAVEC